MTKHKLIFIHGMGEGSSRKSYEILWNNIKKNLQNPNNFTKNYERIDVEWQTVTYKAEKKIFNSAFPKVDPSFTPSAFSVFQPIKAARWFMTFYVGDIIAYTADPENTNGIRKGVWEQIKAHCKTGPYSILAHSLGSIIAFDYLYKLFETDTLLFPDGGNTKIDSFKDHFRHLFTFGSPIGLFLLRQGKLWANNQPFSTIKNPVPKGCTWLNFYDKQDVAAYPLKRLFATNKANKGLPLEDIEVQTGNLVFDSHTDYWENDELAINIASVLSA